MRQSRDATSRLGAARRDLGRELAAEFRTRIEMRQIGVPGYPHDTREELVARVNLPSRGLLHKITC